MNFSKMCGNDPCRKTCKIMIKINTQNYSKKQNLGAPQATLLKQRDKINHQTLENASF